MERGAITGYIDVAQVVLYFFWAFLAMLIIYLRREDKREGYPLESERSEFVTVRGYPNLPSPKTFLLADGSIVEAPVAGGGPDRRPVKATPSAPWYGAPLIPDGDPMLDGVGPASYAARSDTPDLTYHGTPKLVPLRLLPEFHVDQDDPDPRGKEVVGCDDKVGGICRDVWVDRAEYIIRYFEVETSGPNGPRNVLLPTTLSRVSGSTGKIKVNSILAKHFANVPAHRNPDVVTRLEEDRICAYYVSGHLYATPGRSEPFI